MVDLPFLKSLTSVAPIRTLANRCDAPPFDKIFIERSDAKGRKLSNGIILTVSKDVKPDVDTVIDELEPPFYEYKGPVNDTLRECFTLEETLPLGRLNFARIIHPDGIVFSVKHARLTGTLMPIDYVYRLFNDIRHCLFHNDNCKLHTVGNKPIYLSHDQMEFTAYMIAYYFYKDTTEFK